MSTNTDKKMNQAADPDLEDSEIDILLPSNLNSLQVPIPAVFAMSSHILGISAKYAASRAIHQMDRNCTMQIKGKKSFQ